MAIKDLLIQIDAFTAPEAQLAYALGIAEAHGAHTIGVAHAPSGVASLRNDAQFALGAFARAGEQRGLTVETRLTECAPGDFAGLLALQARHTDMTVIGQPATDGSQGRAQTAVYEELLFHSGRPVLVVPWAGRPKPVPQTAIVAWDASSTAARALADALPILRQAAKTIILVATDGQSTTLGADPGTDIAQHLARHDVDVELRCIPLDPETQTADLLLSQVADLGADLMVMGGYHHSRMREYILGGVTRTIMKTMTVPVLMSH